MQVNCQSLPAKRESFFCLIEEQKPDIVVGTESWLSSHHSDNECFPTDHYTVIRRDRGGNTRGGGVFIAARNDLIIVREDTLETNCEILWCSLKLASSKTLFIGAYYRPHEGDAESLAELQLSLSRLNMQHLVLLAGDFNFPGWKWSTHEVQNCNYPALHHQFGDMLDDSGLTQLVEEPTRNNNTLDLVLTNNPTLVSEVSVISGISDHDCPVINLKSRVSQRKKKPRRSIPQYGKAKWDQFSNYMEAIGEEITTQQDKLTADGMWRMFADGIHKGMKEFIPHKMVKVGSHLPWFTQDLKTLHNRRDRLGRQKRLLTRNNQPISDSLNKKLNSVKSDIQREARKSYWSYAEKIITPDSQDEYKGMKRFWKFIKYNKTDSCSISQLKKQGKSITDPENIADALNQQFESVFTRETDVPGDILPDTSHHPQMPDILFTLPGVLKLFENLKIHKAPGPDRITPRVLQMLAPVIAPTLTCIFNKSYQTGQVPDDWLKANVVPVFKKGNKTDPVNYRPISLTCTCCKLMEHIVTSNIMRHATENYILYPLQYGFRSGRSCETQLTGFISNLHNNLQQGRQTDVIVLDMAKAFDKGWTPAHSGPGCS